MPVEKKHDFTKKEIIAGTLVLTAGVVLLAFILVVQGWRPPKETKDYYARFGNIIGLKNNAEVRFGGMIVGNVTEIRPDDEDRTKIRVAIAVESHIPVNDESIASITTLSLTSEPHLEISTGDTESSLLDTGEEIQAVTSSGGFIDIPNLDGLVAGSEDLIGDLRGLLGVKEALEAEEAGEGEQLASATEIFNDLRRFLGIQEAEEIEAGGGEEMASVTRITQDLRDLLGVQEAQEAAETGEGEFYALADITSSVGGLFEENAEELNEIIELLPEIERGAQELLDELNALLSDNRENIDSSLASLESIMDTLNRDLEGVMELVKDLLSGATDMTDGLNDVVQENRPALEDLLGDLGVASQNLNVLLQDLKHQPQSVIWGKPEQGRR